MSTDWQTEQRLRRTGQISVPPFELSTSAVPKFTLIVVARCGQGWPSAAASAAVAKAHS